jgi:hypothetical protein
MEYTETPKLPLETLPEVILPIIEDKVTCKPVYIKSEAIQGLITTLLLILREKGHSHKQLAKAINLPNKGSVSMLMYGKWFPKKEEKQIELLEKILGLF